MKNAGTLSQRRYVLPLLLVLSAQTVLLAIGAVGALRASVASVSLSPLDQSPGALPLTIETGQPIAQAYAHRWSAAATLVAVTMRLDWPESAIDWPAGELPASGWLIYLYSDGQRTVSIYLDRGSGRYIANAESPFGDGLSLLDLTTYPRSSTIAAAAADIIEGHAYRTACPESRSSSVVTATVGRVADGAAFSMWTVTYGDAENEARFDVVVRVDAQSGSVLRSDVRERDCGG